MKYFMEHNESFHENTMKFIMTLILYIKYYSHWHAYNIITINPIIAILSCNEACTIVIRTVHDVDIRCMIVCVVNEIADKRFQLR